MQGFAFCNELFDASPFETATRLAALGYAGIELDARCLATLDLEQFRRHCAEQRIAIVGLHWLIARESLHLTHPDATIRANTLCHLQTLVAQCAQLGGQVMVLGSGRQRRLLDGVTFAQGMQFAAETLTVLGGDLVAHNVRLGIEPLAASDNFITHAHIAAELVERVACSHIGLTLDVRAMQAETRPRDELIRTYRKYLAHIHVNDASGKGAGMGATDLRPMLSALRATDYRGWISVEAFDATPDAATVARASLDYLKRNWGSDE